MRYADHPVYQEVANRISEDGMTAFNSMAAGRINQIITHPGDTHVLVRFAIEAHRSSPSLHLLTQTSDPEKRRLVLDTALVERCLREVYHWSNDRAIAHFVSWYEKARHVLDVYEEWQREHGLVLQEDSTQ